MLWSQALSCLLSAVILPISISRPLGWAVRLHLRRHGCNAAHEEARAVLGAYAVIGEFTFFPRLVSPEVPKLKRTHNCKD